MAGFHNKTNWCWTLGAQCIEKCDSHGWSYSAFCWKCSFVNHSSNQKMAFYLTFIRQLPIISSCTRTRIYLQPRRQFADRTQIPISCLPCTNQDTSQIHLRRRHKSIFANRAEIELSGGSVGHYWRHCGSFHPQRSTTENPLLSPESRYGSQPRPSSSSSSLSAWSSSLLSTSSSSASSSQCRLLSPVPLEE